MPPTKVLNKEKQKEKAERNIEIAKKLLAKNSSIEEIMELTELSEKEIMQLKEDK